jgi:hypothetical protein
VVVVVVVAVVAGTEGVFCFRAGGSGLVGLTMVEVEVKVEKTTASQRERKIKRETREARE